MTGLIYVAIIAVWAIVLVPKWLKRHDHLDPQRSVHRFSRSMQTLATRPTVLGIPLPAETQGHETRDAGAESAPMPAEVISGGGRNRANRAAQGRPTGGQHRRRAASSTESGAGTTSAGRRRVVLGILAAATVGSGVLVLLGVLSPAILIAPLVLLAGFVLVARHQVGAGAAARRDGEAEHAPASSAAPAPVAHAVTPATGATWEARQTPLPRYVTEGAAPDAARGGAPGAWTAAAMLERAQQERARAERMAQAKARAIARAKEEQEAAESRSRDDDYLSAEAVWPQRRRAVNE